MKKPKTISKLKKDADRVFSIFIRTRDKGRCFTCGVVKPIKQMQNGHYISRTYSNTRYDLQNCHCQCVGCNIFRKGNMDEYAIALTQKYGPDILNELSQRKKVFKKFTRDDLQDIINRYSQP